VELQEETAFATKLAVTFLAELMANVQVVLVPEHAPPHPEKVLPPAGVAVRVTLVLDARLAEQVVPQEMPPMLLVTVPDPVPVLLTGRP
jgi:hypothetical protein